MAREGGGQERVGLMGGGGQSCLLVSAIVVMCMGKGLPQRPSYTSPCFLSLLLPPAHACTLMHACKHMENVAGVCVLTSSPTGPSPP